MITGTWATIEVNKAIEKDIRLKKFMKSGILKRRVRIYSKDI